MSAAVRRASLCLLLALACDCASNAADLGAGGTADAGWPGYNGGYDATRFSPLDRINTKNVASLREVARFRLPETMSFQCNPTVVGDTVYLTTLKNTYALDARSAKQRWVHKYEPKSMGLNTSVRGVAYADGRVFRGFPDGHLVALDAKTGDVRWDVVGTDAKAGEYYTVAPVVWEGRLYVGNSGSGVGAIGHVRAFDVKDGKRLWNIDTVPSTGEAARTWPDGPGKVKAGGGMYSSFALDTETGMLYVPVGNPGPITPEGTRFLPGTQGGTNWYGPSYSPPLNTVFVPAIDWATTLKLGGPETLKHEPGKPFLGSANAFGTQDPDDQKFGHLTAIDADSGAVKWKYDTDTPMVAAVTPTAGGVVLTGDTHGNFLAFDAHSGDVLLKKDLGDPIGGGVVTYLLDGTQYVAVVGGMNNPIVQTKSGPAWVAILALPK